jgi:predicted nucleotidyltransferase
MGRTSAKTGLAGALFSNVQLRVLSLLIGEPEREFHASELIRLARSGSGAVQRELAKLAKAGVLEVKEIGNRKLYRANRQCPIFEELHGLIVKTVGLIEPLRAALRPFGADIDAAFVFGSVARGADTAGSDIDLMIVANGIAYSELYAALQKAEKAVRRTINPNLMSMAEWSRKLAGRNAFVRKVRREPKLFVLGTEHELEGTR